jgi:shikimate dehydrogenase
MVADSSHRRAAVLGHPIAHSLSPTLHRTAYTELGLQWSYDAADVTSDQLGPFVASLGPEWVGLSLTMPLKEAVLPLLAQVDPDAARVRAVNTVVFAADGARGYNTDVTGLVGLLQAARADADAPDSSTTEATALVVGAGATARSTVAALSAIGVCEIAVSARRSEAVTELLELASKMGLPARAAAWPPQASDFGRELVISTVPASIAGEFAVPSSPQLLVDVLYDPWPTPLAVAWQDEGGRVVGGLELLVRQAVEQVVLMTGRRPSLDAMRAAGQRVLDERAGRSDIAQAEQ